MSDILQAFGAQLKAARDAEGISQRALAERIGIPQPHLSKIERGMVDLSVTSLEKWAEALGLEVRLMPHHRPCREAGRMTHDPALKARMDQIDAALEAAARQHGESAPLHDIRQLVKDLRESRAPLEEKRLPSIAVLLQTAATGPEGLGDLLQARSKLQQLLQDMGVAGESATASA